MRYRKRSIPGRARKWLIRLLVSLILLGVGAAGGSWLAGRMMLDKFQATVGLNRSVEVEADLLLALPVVNWVYGRNVAVNFNGGPHPAKISFGRIKGRMGRTGDDRAWIVDLGEVRWECGSGALTATRMSVKGRRDHDRLELTDGHIEYFVLSTGRSAMTAFTQLDFRRLAFDAEAGRALIRAILAEDESSIEADNPLAAFWEIDEARLRNFKVGLAFFDGYETPPLNVALTGYNNKIQWDLKLEMSSLRAAADEAGPGQLKRLSGFLNRGALNMTPAALLHFERIRLTGGGHWADEETDQNGDTRVLAYFLFPRLFSLTFNGHAPAVTRGEARDWLAGCFLDHSEDDGRPRCLSALSFSGFDVDYGDRGLGYLVRPIKNFGGPILEAADPAGPLGPPALGLALGIWLDAHGRQDPVGSFIFKPDEGAIHPFRRDFLENLRDGSIEPVFTPAGPGDQAGPGAAPL